MRAFPHAVRLLALAAAVLSVSSSFARSEELNPGSAAPKIEVKTWLKGTPVKDFEAGKTYVVEFWATWCGPCLQSIPHVTELARKNKDVTFIGVSIWEDEEGDKLPKFVAEMGDKMDYNVGYSGNKEGMATTWMEAAGQNGIPTAFIVKDQKVQWIGHPMEMDEPLAKVTAGTFDLDAFRADYAKQMAEQKEMSEIYDQIEAARKLFDAGKRQEAHAALDAVDTKYPKAKKGTDGARFAWLMVEDLAAWEAKAKAMVAGGEEDKLMEVAGLALDNMEKQPDLARKAIALAVDNNSKKSVAVWYFGSVIYTTLKEPKKAYDLAILALAELPNSPYKDNEDIKKELESMRDKAKPDIK